MCLRSVVHCALAAAVALTGVALTFLRLGAEFVGLAQILVYVGAVAMLVLFAVILTRTGGAPEHAPKGREWFWGLAAAGVVTGILLVSILSSPRARTAAPVTEDGVTTLEIGRELMGRQVVALEALGVLLTAALIGGVVVAMDASRQPAKGERR